VKLDFMSDLKRGEATSWVVAAAGGKSLHQKYGWKAACCWLSNLSSGDTPELESRFDADEFWT
jgi:hypothetical protein